MINEQINIDQSEIMKKGGRMEMRADREAKIDFQPKHLRNSLGANDRKWEELRQVAYNLYEKKGRTRGTELASWFEAAQILKSRKE
jgi:hypothetical protein